VGRRHPAVEAQEEPDEGFFRWRYKLVIRRASVHFLDDWILTSNLISIL
jgi:hypothetical protein